MNKYVSFCGFFSLAAFFLNGLVFADPSDSDEMTAAEIAEAFKEAERAIAEEFPETVGEGSDEFVLYFLDEPPPISVLFDFQSVELSLSNTKKLDLICEIMQSHSNSTTFHMVGYADEVVPENDPARLSLERALAVKSYITQNCEIESTRLTATGVGASNIIRREKPNGHLNRRVEFLTTQK